MLGAGSARTSFALAAAVAALGLGGCAPRARMCRATSECAAKSACVAGRCQLEGANLRPAIDSARRLVASPTEIAFVSKRHGAPGALPMNARLGKDGGKLLLRFEVALPPAASVIEAYVVLRRSPWVDDDPAPLSLHATRIIEAWHQGSISWARQPRALDARLPSTTIDPAGPSLVRVDVRDIVRQWARRDPRDHGLAIVAEGESPTGMSFALVAGSGDDVGGAGGSADERAAAGVIPSAPPGPYLEVYLR